MADGGEIDEGHPVSEAFVKLFGYGEREPSLAHAAGTGECDQARAA